MVVVTWNLEPQAERYTAEQNSDYLILLRKQTTHPVKQDENFLLHPYLFKLQ